MSGPQSPRRQRADLQALRALAVLSVVLYHLWPDRLPGGFVGVDVFFVISGFLITTHLLDELTATGRIRLAAFWARRAKRLLPASLTTLAATAVGIWLVTPASLQRGFLDKVLAATLYVENWALARDSIDYQKRDAATPPTQHFWSLSTEEQFYVAVPLLLVAVALLLRGRPAWRRPAAGLLLGVLTVASLGYAVWQLGDAPTYAYFNTGTRAWEFLAGGLIGLLPALGPVIARQVVTWAGLAAIGVSCVLFDEATSMPGWPALVPVLGAAAAIAGGAESLEWVGRIRPIRWIGDTSYAIYLWHWPLIILLPEATGHPLTTVQKLAILVVTLFVSGLSTRFLEEPIRFSPRLLGGARRPLTVLAASAVAMAVIGGGCVAASAHLRGAEELAARRAAAVTERDPACLGAAAVDPAKAPCKNPELDGVLVPDPATAKQDDANRPECWGTDAGKARICTLADPPGATKHVLAIGDSHNNTLLDAYAAIGKAEGWKIEASGHSGCYFTTAAQTAPDKASARDCVAWNHSVTAYATKAGIDAVIVTHRDGGVEARPGMSEAETVVEGLVQAWRSLPDVPIVAIRDNPSITNDIVTCVEQGGLEGADRCGRAKSAALNDDGQAAAVAQVPNAHLVDLTDFYCTDYCPAVIGHVLVYRDRTHITRTWARTLTPYLRRGIVAALAKPVS